MSYFFPREPKQRVFVAPPSSRSVTPPPPWPAKPWTATERAKTPQPCECLANALEMLALAKIARGDFIRLFYSSLPSGFIQKLFHVLFRFRPSCFQNKKKKVAAAARYLLTVLMGGRWRRCVMGDWWTNTTRASLYLTMMKIMYCPFKFIAMFWS